MLSGCAKSLLAYSSLPLQAQGWLTGPSDIPIKTPPSEDEQTD